MLRRVLCPVCLVLLCTLPLAAQPVLREGGQPAPVELTDQIVQACSAWLRPSIDKLSYTFTMTQVEKNNSWRAVVEYTAPDLVSVGWGEGKSFSGKIDNAYDPENSAYPPGLTTLLQGTTFFGPLHELVLDPRGHTLKLIGEEKLGDADTVLVQLTGTRAPSEQALARWEERLRRQATRPQYLYEFLPVQKTVDGALQTMMEIRPVKEPGPGWEAIKAAYEKDPARVAWGGQIITAQVREFRGEQRPVIVINRDPAYTEKSPIRLTQFSNGVNNMTLKLTLGEGESALDETALKELEERTPKPGGILAMRVGCGIWGSWFGYSGGGASVDQVWFDKATRLPLREEGFYQGKPRFTVAYSDFEQLAAGRSVPRHAVVTLLGEGGVYPWVFDMTFKPQGGAWLLDKLSEYYEGSKLGVTAEVSNVTAQPAAP